LDSYLSVNKYNSKSNNELLDNFVKVYSPGGNSRLDCLHGQSIIPINDKYDSLYSVRDNSKVILKQEFYGVTGKSESMHAVTTVQGYNTFSSNAQSLEKDLFSRHPDVLRINHNKREMEVVTGCSTPTRYYMHTIGSYQCENSQLAINNAKTLLEQCLSENLSSSHQLSKADEPVFVLDFKPLKRILLQHDIKVFDRHTDTMKKAMDSLIHGSENGDKFKNHSYFSVWGNSYKMRMKEAPSSNKELYDKVITWLEKTNSSNNDNYSPQLASLIRELKRLTGDIANQWHSVNKLW